ncbi:MAG: hypothetical protein PHD15_03435 [Clostridia bacterium]|nr:hypothetical protein [Clostridia bacterium]MDD4386794.1 hypothetical protein [Clostridia bacterium]
MIVTGLKIEISQINAVDLNNILDRQFEIEESMEKIISSKDLDVSLVAVTDIINCNSEIIALGNRTDVIEKAFNVKLKNNRSFLKGIVSRKKQILPNIMEASK